MAMTTEVRELVDEGAARLRRVADDPRHEAEILLGAALGQPRSWLLAHPEQRVLDCAATDRFEAQVTRRAHGEPIAYILGEKEFWSLPLLVEPAVLIPRPETELVVERALAHLPPDSRSAVLDLAAGSGAIALAIAKERPGCRVIGTDILPDAVSLAIRNAVRLGLERVEFHVGSWFDPVADEVFDLIASNPPYIAEDDSRVEPCVRRFEPHAALFSGPTGLEALREITAGAPRHLKPGGWLVVEHGDTQGEAVRGVMCARGFVEVATHRDLAGRDRCTEGRRPS
ncbi:MAG: peptide chain release factor N(5)-glutamine methyltransferase [Gammaproteobacteria bacterium]|nr:peptide chain release factor N(5)-glutamine methyltransferase [Gammaproteobacteria bacterium]